MADWYIYQHDGDPLGPWATDVVAEAILTGKLAPDVWVAAPGGPRWLRALDVPVIGRLVEGVPTKPRRDSGLRLIPGAFTSEDGRPVFGATMMIVKDDEIYAAQGPATTRRGPGPGVEETLEMAARPASLRSDELAEDARPAARVIPEAGVDSEEPATDPQLPPSSTPSPPTAGSNAPAAELRRRHRA